MKSCTKILLCIALLYQGHAAAQVQGRGGSLTGSIGSGVQNSSSLSNVMFEQFLNNREKKNHIRFEDIQGSPYDPEEFTPGEFLLADNPPLELNMRYNMYDDEIEVLEDDGAISAFLRNFNTSFRIGEKHYQPFQYSVSGYTRDGIFQVLVDGGIKLLLRRKIILIPPEEAPNPNQQDRSAKFVEQTDYYTIIGNDQPKPFREKKGSILKLFPEQAPKIKAYIKENKLKAKRQEDLIRIFEFLNGIV